MTSEEVQRVFEALNAVEAIQDPEAKSRARSQITAAMRKLSAGWAKDRGALARQIKEREGDDASVRDIAKRLGVSPGTVQDLLRGYKGSGQNRPRATDSESPDGSDAQ